MPRNYYANARVRTSHGASHKGDGLKDSGYPNVCSGCGKRVYITGDISLWFETGADGKPTSWHNACYPRTLVEIRR